MWPNQRHLISLNAAIMIMAALSAVTAAQIAPKGENVSDTQSLNSQIQVLKANIRRWNNANMLFIAIVALGAAGLVFTGLALNRKNDDLADMQDTVSEQEKQATAKAQKETADAQLALRKYIDNIARHQEGRFLDRKVFLEQLKDKPTGSVDIRYKDKDVGAYLLAFQLWKFLEDASGWKVSEPLPYPGVIPPNLPGILSDSRITVRAKDASETMGTPGTSLKALTDALGFGMGGGMGTGISGEDDPALPANRFVVLIDQKP
jgi:hypothetical protein